MAATFFREKRASRTGSFVAVLLNKAARDVPPFAFVSSLLFLPIDRRGNFADSENFSDQHLQ